MRLLLDTHVWLWQIAAPERLSGEARDILARSDTRLYLSAASGWEMSIKQKLGRLDLGGAAELVVPDLMLRSDVAPMSITHQHALRAGALPRHHRDPFDRMLIAQAQLEQLPIMTSDAAFAMYDVELIASVR
jgi:PIN domain nuclease of toxin-antitoxin system